MKRIHLHFYNSFTNEFLGDVEMNWDRIKAVNGWYSKFWRGMKIGLSNLYKLDKHWVRVKIRINNQKGAAS